MNLHIAVVIWHRFSSRTLATIALSVHPKTWLAPLPDQTFEVKELLVQHSKRMGRNEYNPSSGLLPRQLGSGVAHNRDMGLGNGLLEFASNQAVAEFVGVVQILATVPSFKGGLRPFCKAKGGGGYIYRLAVTVADKSTSTVAVVSEATAEKIIGMPASEAAYKNEAASFIDPNVTWEATIRSVQTAGKTFFVLVGVEQK
jgi:hypothetical protein